MQTRLILSLTAGLLLFMAARLQAQGTAFTYNGQLYDGAGPANGLYDLRFTLYNALTNGSIASSETNVATGITNGLFMVTLDFGNIFSGTNYWLELAARTNAGTGFTALSPRQPVLPVPYAIFAANAGNAATAGSANSVLAGNIAGTLSPAQLPGIVVTNGGTVTGLNGAFNGNGGGLTNLSTAAIAAAGFVSNNQANVAFTDFLLVTNTAPLAGYNSDTLPALGACDASLTTNALIGFTINYGNIGGPNGLYNCGYIDAWLNPVNGYQPLAAVPNGGGCVQNYIWDEHWNGMPSDNRFNVGLAEMWGPDGIGGGMTEFLVKNSTNAPAVTGGLYESPIVMDGYNRVQIARNFNYHTEYTPGTATLDIWDGLDSVPALRFHNGGLCPTPSTRGLECDSSGNLYWTGNNTGSRRPVFVGLNGLNLTNLNAANLTGTVSLAAMPAAVVTNTASGVTLTGTFAGSGSGLTNVPAGAIVGGITTNILIGGHTLYITNGIVMNVQ